MAIRVYNVPVRNDLSDSVTQFNDVFPNTSQTTDLNPIGQTGYVNPGYVVSNPAGAGAPVYEYPLAFGVPTLTSGAGITTLTNTGYIDGVAAWLLDNIACAGGVALLVEQARSAAARIVCRAVKGQTLTLASLVACINASNGINSGANPTLTNLYDNGGGLIGASGSGVFKTNAQMVEEVIKILSGQVYRMLNGAVVANDAGPNIYTAVAHNPPTADGNAVSATNPGLAGFLTAPNTNTTADQTWPASLDYVPFRTYYYGTGILASANEGQLSRLAGHTGDPSPFHFNAAKLSDGVTAATYGTTSANGAVLQGTARPLQHRYAVTSISAANPAVVTFTGNHGFVVNDVIRLNNCVQAGTILTNTTYKVQAVGAATTCALKSVANVNVNNTAGGSGAGAGGYITLEESVGSAAVFTATDNASIPSTGLFRAVVVYDEEGNVLSV